MLAELLASPGVEERVSLAGELGVMALHGGLEAGTVEVAESIAASAAVSLYAVVQPDDLRWHVPSIRYDPQESPAFSRFLEHVRLVVSIHGFGRKGSDREVLLGGRNRRLAELISAAALHRGLDRVITNLDEMPQALRGLHPRNPVNLPELGGVQIELSVGARQPALLEALIESVSAVLAAEQRSLCAAPGAVSRAREIKS